MSWHVPTLVEVPRGSPEWRRIRRQHADTIAELKREAVEEPAMTSRLLDISASLDGAGAARERLLYLTDRDPRRERPPTLDAAIRAEALDHLKSWIRRQRPPPSQKGSSFRLEEWFKSRGVAKPKGLRNLVQTAHRAAGLRTWRPKARD
jgi:hypothetical protein